MTRIIFLPLISVMLAVLSACSATPTVKKAEQIAADEKSNVVILGHSVTIGPLRIERGANPSGQAYFWCENLDTGKTRKCFNKPLQFHQTESGNYLRTTGEYTGDAASPYKVKHGRYKIESVGYSVVVGVDVYTTCNEDSKGHVHCYDSYRDEFDSGRDVLNEAIEFSVSPGAGCYLGSVNLAMQFDRITDFSISDDMTVDFDKDLQRLREGLVDATQSHVTRRCQAQ